MGSITAFPVTTREFKLSEFLAVSPVEPTFSMIGNSLCAPDVPFFAATESKTVESRAVGHWIGAVSMQQVRMKSAYGIGGAIAKTILDTHLDQLVADRPGFAVSILFENDVGQNVALESTAIEIERFAEACVGAGIVPVFVSPLPSIYFTNKSPLWTGITNLVRQACLDYGALFVDGSFYCDPAVADPSPLTGYTHDGIHLSTRGALALADQVWLAIQSRLFQPYPMFGYGYGVPANGVGNIRMTGTSGTKYDSITGSLPNNYAVGKGWGTLSTGAVSVVDEGPQRKIAVDATFSDRGAVFLNTPNTTLASAGLAVGDLVEAFIDVDLVSMEQFETVRLELIPSGSAVREVVGSTSSGWADNVGTITGRTFRFRTPEMTIPVGTTALYFATWLAGKTGFSVQAKLSNPIIRKVPS